MKKIQILLFILLLISIKGLSQYSNYKLNYYGGATAKINGTSDIVNARIPSGTKLITGNVIVYHPKSRYSSGQNVQVMDGIIVYSTSNNFEENVRTDYYGNDYTELSLTSPQTSDFIVQQTYNGQT